MRHPGITAVAIAAALLLSGCRADPKESVVDGLEAIRATWNGHSYIVFVGERRGDMSVTNDPDCPLCLSRLDSLLARVPASDTTDVEWRRLRLAIAMTESGLNPAVTNGDQYGLLQIRPVYVAEANRLAGEERFTHEDALDPALAMEMFDIVQEAHNPKRDIRKAIKLHSSGGTGKGDSAYAERTLKNIRTLERLEKLIEKGL